MKLPFGRDVPTGAAITITALVLLASVVTGREDNLAPAPVLEPVPAAALSLAASADLDLDRLRRTKKDSEPQDIFATRASQAMAAPQVAVAAVAKPAPPPVPTAPPLPYKYLGRMADESRILVFLARNENSLSAAVGDTLDGAYRIESISESSVQFTYLPLGVKQTLGVPAPY